MTLGRAPLQVKSIYCFKLFKHCLKQVLRTKRCILQLPISIWIGHGGSKRVQQPLGLRENKETNFRENSSNQTRCEPAENTREEEPVYTNEGKYYWQR